MAPTVGTAATVADDAPTAPVTASPEDAERGGRRPFEVHLENFSGPFDLLLSLIAKHRLDITEVALGAVTDEFIAHIRRAGLLDRNLGEASEFLVVAATLLDLKAARLLPSGVVDDAEDLELLEARDLLFARLLQYRAYKQVADLVSERLAAEGRRFPRQVQLEPHLAAMLPELVWQVGPEELARVAARVLAPREPAPGVDLSHLHAPAVSVREQARIVAERLREHGPASFRTLVAGVEPPVAVARFLSLLELFRQGVVGFDQVEPLGELTVRWSGSDDAAQVGDDLAELDATEFDGDEPDSTGFAGTGDRPGEGAGATSEEDA
ncbi:segregation and condensation protein A [Paraoerskovia sediminicola]|uniref:segregation and condensation protein A n=1 Tax=Paraoerskovia sediminicola TaxID=1138587 RepID=UPI003D9AB75D